MFLKTFAACLHYNLKSTKGLIVYRAPVQIHACTAMYNTPGLHAFVVSTYVSMLLMFPRWGLFGARIYLVRMCFNTNAPNALFAIRFVLVMALRMPACLKSSPCSPNLYAILMILFLRFCEGFLIFF